MRCNREEDKNVDRVKLGNWKKRGVIKDVERGCYLWESIERMIDRESNWDDD